MLPEIMPGMLMLAYLAGLFLLTFFGNSFIPLPVTAYVIWLAQFHHPYWVVVVGALGTASGWWVMDRWFRPFFLRHRHAQRHLPQWFVTLFQRYTGVILFLSNALPIPLDPVRFLALMQNYPRQRIMVAMTLGRIVRYSLLVFVGEWLSAVLPKFNQVLLLLVVVSLALALIKALIRTKERSVQEG